MKKTVVFAVMALLSASSVFAASTKIDLDISSTGKSGLSLYGGKTGVTISPGAAGTTLIGKTSTGVGLGAITDTPGYALETQHKNGTKAYGSAYDSTSIYQKDVTAGTSDTSGYSKTGSDAFGTGWTTM
ncbi:hypothetical protein F6V25_05650 [Oryzomonas japonica]|uniref:Uncharacterized protein n=1 Tax=Oryzomonas japonica TaxID=2603858 RepID=A0A7J4ZU74_9BACT|nr:hypothetical protein [Oryzomonas japonica]KAB0666896.1 hypothetical protein F6V25_05650 [Oryzomonas japonica]